ncbi:kinase suppressor of Ras 1-like isoform X1 [Seriola lalandi dorsalis]|uniref:kinase suppressor of Ras 1-like isoform X1 n=2 Tax=Seriola lalandi dorsalis TaxID=1841481 RepID=UPI000C6FA0D9|nr:kinase suppressor of Ras 1-like isoform X1 [Seriola lalandi dorsalis]XP_056230537.1 kinase suppressor of Ras 1-like isoform X1 [Seriola aureovittata]
MDRGAGRGDRGVRGGRTKPGGAEEALRQCRLIQNLVDISTSSLQALRTRCTATNDLTQQEIRTLEVKLTEYMWTQLQWKQRVPERERPAALSGYPRLENWLLTADLTPQFIQAAAGKLSVDRLLQMSSSELQDTMRRLGSNSEDCSRLTAALSCLKSADETGGDLRTDSCRSESQQDSDAPSPISAPSSAGSPSTPLPPTSSRSPSVSISVAPCSDDQRPADGTTDIFAVEPSAQTSKTRTAKPSHTPPPPSRKLLQLLPNIALTRSKSQESQLANRIEEPAAHRAGKKNKVLAAIHINGNGPEDSALPSPLLSARTPGPVPASAPYMMPGTPTLLDNVAMHRSSPQTMRRDIGLAVTHRFSTKSWLSQTCQVCHKSMMFGVKCKHCKLKCHNKCTKDAPSCRISFLTLPRMRRAESVPSDINNRIDHTAEIPQQYGTLPKAITKREPPITLNQMDSSSNPSSATSSTPSSPAHFQQSNPPSVSTTPPPNASPRGSRDNRFHFPDVPASTYPAVQQSVGYYESGASQVSVTDTQLPAVKGGEEEEAEEDYPAEDEEAADRRSSKKSFPTEECDEDGLEDLPSSICRRGAAGRWKGQISRKASQTSVYLQEWDIPYEQLQLGELIGKGRWGKVHKGRWHGEVAIRLMEVDGNNQDHLKLFKKEVMNYRQTRHENVVLFMGACMAPPHLAIITSFCKGLTLYSVVRERGSMLDINKTRQIAQEIVKGMGYLHAKGIIHKDLKSKNVFYDTNKVVITDFGLFGMSGVVQEGRRKNVLRIPQGWIYYLAPEIVRKMSPEVDEDQLPFSKAADVYAFGTVWYELQVGDWPITKQPVEAKIWQVGSGEGIKKVLADSNLGKEVTEILSACWSAEPDDRPTFTQLTGMLERLPKLNRRLSHPGHFWKRNESWDHHHCLRDHCHQGLRAHCPYMYKYSS